MSFANRHNKVNRWGIDTKGFDYKKISEIIAADGEDTVYKVYGVLLHKGGKYGDSAAVILESCYVNLPNHMAADVEKILDTEEDCADIRAGVVGIEFYSYESKNGNVCYSANWVDM